MSEHASTRRLSVALVLASLVLCGTGVLDAGIVSPGAPAIRRAPTGPTVVVPAGPAMPSARRDVMLISVCGRVDDGPQQLGPAFVADLADRPAVLKLTVEVFNPSDQAVLLYPDIVNHPYQLLRARGPEPIAVAPRGKQSFELEYRLRGLYETKMTEIPFAVGLVLPADFVDEMPANNVLDCKLMLGRPDVVVTAMQVQPRILAGPPERASGQEPMNAVVCALVTVVNQGNGRLPDRMAQLDWSATWSPADILWGVAARHAIRLVRSRNLAGPIEPPIYLPPLEPGAATVIWLQEFSPVVAKPDEGRVLMELTVTSTLRSGDLVYDELDRLNNHRTFEAEYFVPDVFAYHPIRGTDYANR